GQKQMLRTDILVLKSIRLPEGCVKDKVQVWRDWPSTNTLNFRQLRQCLLNFVEQSPLSHPQLVQNGWDYPFILNQKDLQQVLRLNLRVALFTSQSFRLNQSFLSLQR